MAFPKDFCHFELPYHLVTEYGGFRDRKVIEMFMRFANLLGYLTWGPIDLVSAGTGEMDKRYGFISVDKNNQSKGTLERTPKKSFYWYKDVIVSNGEKL